MIRIYFIRLLRKAPAQTRVDKGQTIIIIPDIVTMGRSVIEIKKTNLVHVHTVYKTFIHVYLVHTSLKLLQVDCIIYKL